MKLFLTLVCALLIRHVVSAQTLYNQDYSLRQLTDEDGLPQNSVRNIIRDDLGFMWLATEGGLVRYDGKHTKNFSRKMLRIESDRFYDFQYNPDNHKIYAFSEFERAALISKGMASVDPAYVYVRDIDKAPLWASIGLGLTKPNDIQQLLSRNKKRKHLVIVAGPTRHFACFDHKIIQFDKGKATSVIRFEGMTDFDHFPATGDLRLNLDNLISTDNELFYCPARLGTRFIHLSQPGNTNRELTLGGDITRNASFGKHGHETKIFANRVNNQLLGVLADCVYLIKYDKQKKTLTTEKIVGGFDNDHHGVLSFYYNALDGNLFAGTRTNGLLILSKKVLTSVHSETARNDDPFYAQTALNDSVIMVPDGRRAVAGKTPTLSPKPGDVAGGGVPFTLLRDKSGNIWTRSAFKIIKMDSTTRHIKATWSPVKEPSRIYQGVDGNIWIGFRDGELAILDEHNLKHPFLKVTTAHADITFLHQANKDTLWIGTNKGLFFWITASKRLLPVRQLQQKSIRSIFRTPPNHLWVTTYGDGIFLLRNNTVNKMPADANGFLNYAHCMVEDDLGNFWIPSNKGLFQVPIGDMIAFAEKKLSSVYYRYYNKSDGLLTNEFNGGCQPCGVLLGNGYISLPSMNGLVFVRPSIPLPSSLSEIFIIDEVLLDGKALNLADTLHLNYNFGTLGLRLAAPFFVDRNNLNMTYSLRSSDGRFSKGPTAIGTDLSIDIYNLSDGEYTLEIRKITGFTGASAAKTITLVVAPAWFMRWWSIACAAATLAILIFAYNRWRTASLRRRNQLLAKRVDERTRDLSETMQKLLSSEASLNRQLQVQMRMTAVLSHDLRSPLKFLSRYAQKLYEKLAVKPDSVELVELGQSLADSATRTFELTDNLLGFIKTTMAHDGKIDETIVNVTEVLKEKAAIFDHLAKERQTQIRVESTHDLAVQINRQYLEIIIHNLLDNAVKASWGDIVSVTARRESDQVILAVSDTAGGMPDDIAAWLTLPVELTSDQAVSVPPDLGLGLLMVKELANIAGITLSVESNDASTTIQLYASDKLIF